MKVLFDTNVVLDFLQHREPFFEDARDLMTLVAVQEITGMLTAKEVTDIHYVIRKSLGDAGARERISDLLSLFTLADTSAGDVQGALFSPASDFEDAVMVATGVRCGASVVVTRDVSGFEGASVSIMQPDELLDQLHPRA